MWDDEEGAVRGPERPKGRIGNEEFTKRTLKESQVMKGLKMRRRILNFIRDRIGNQCSLARMGVMWAVFC